jgi:CBS domain-containing protein
MKVHQIMTAHARCASPDNAIVEAAGLMRELDVGALPVCENDQLAGMVTDRDIVLRGVANGRDVYETTVREVMSPGVLWIFADQEVEEAARIMEEKQIRRLPVLNRQKRLVGILSLGDVAVTSHPAFSGKALREVSETAEQRMRGGRSPTVASSPRVGADGAKREEAPGGAPRAAAKSRQTGRRGLKDTGSRAGKTGSKAARSGSTRQGQVAAGGSRRSVGRNTTHGATGRAAGAQNQPKPKKKAATGRNPSRKRPASVRAAR